MTTPSGGQLHINTKYHWLGFLLAAFKPKAMINGHEMSLNWGDNVIPVPPGRHDITIWVPYLWKFGTAQATVDTSYGGQTVYYAAPVWTWQRGAIGPQPVAPPGVTAAFVAYGLIALAFLLCCCGVILAGGNS